MPTPSTSDTATRPTHHITLYDGTNKIGLTLCDGMGRADEKGIRRESNPRGSLKVFSGVQRYSDLESPWTSTAQEDWAGGRGGEDFDRDASMFAESRWLNTILPGRVIMGPHAIPEGANRHWPPFSGDFSDNRCIAAVPWYNYYGMSFVPATTITNGTTIAVCVHVRQVGTPANALTIQLFGNTSGAPGTGREYGSIAVTAATGDYDEWRDVWVNIALTADLTAGTTYWVVAASLGGTTANHWRILCRGDVTSGKANLSGWVDFYPIFFAIDTVYKQQIRMAVLRKGLFYFADPEDGTTAPGCMLNGDMGRANSGSTTTLVTAASGATTIWAANEAAGGICILVSGTGSEQARNFRTIASNAATNTGVTTFTFSASDPWDVAPAAGTFFVIVNVDKFTSIPDAAGTTGANMAATTTAGTALAAGQRITDVLSVNTAIYLARGDSVAIRRLRAFDNAGTFTYQWTDETGIGTFLCAGSDQIGSCIWKATGTIPAQINRAPALDCSGTGAVGALVFPTTPVNMPDTGARIAGLDRYGTYGNNYVFTEDAIYEIIEGKPYEVPIHGLRGVKDYRNGRAHLAHDVYLYFSVLSDVQRYYPGQLDGIGPNRLDEGLPSTRNGDVSQLVDYADQIIASVDAGKDISSNRYSSITCWNERGWHEVYRSGVNAMSIRNMFVQAIPGTDYPDRLWFNQGGHLHWMPLAIDPMKCKYYPFAYEGTLSGQWMYNGLHDVPKYFRSFSIVADSGSLGMNQNITLDFEVDQDSVWTEVGSYSFSIPPLPQDELTLPTTTDGYRVRYRLRMNTISRLSSHRLRAMVMQSAVRQIVKPIFGITFRVADKDLDLNGDPDQDKAVTKLGYLETWEDATTPLTIASTNTILDGRTAFLDNLTFRPIYDNVAANIEGFICSATLIDVG